LGIKVDRRYYGLIHFIKLRVQNEGMIHFKKSFVKENQAKFLKVQSKKGCKRRAKQNKNKDKKEMCERRKKMKREHENSKANLSGKNDRHTVKFSETQHSVFDCPII
jgi:hypothetical protein